MKTRVFYYVVEENGEKSGMAYIDFEKGVSFANGFVFGLYEGNLIGFPMWRVIEIDEIGEDDDGEDNGSEEK